MEHDPNRADGTDSRWKCPISPAPLGRSAPPGCIFAMTSSPALAESRSWSTTRRAIPSSCSNRVSPRPVSPTDDWNPLRGRDLLSKPARDLTQAASQYVCTDSRQTADALPQVGVVERVVKTP